MFDFTNFSIDILVLLLRVAVVLLLYFFLWQVLRFVMRDLRSGGAPGGAAAASPYGQLMVLRAGATGVPAGKTFALGPSNIIGRSMENCEIALNDSFLSAQHARLELQGDVWVLEDLNSTNGTFVNEIEVRDAASVEEGDVIRVGRVEMRIIR
ncbi:MAG TPA: FHA domain-containing protein [Kouleothrix sp.]|uniref:FHA domain-containing protein n=1 Tax=Kouleothrix sp. TaxID=2779161 RepID=UPI002BBFB9B9|nr:FHA domain-containing protein [Kouleothrix sp.]